MATIEHMSQRSTPLPSVRQSVSCAAVMSLNEGHGCIQLAQRAGLMSLCARLARACATYILTGALRFEMLSVTKLRNGSQTSMPGAV